MTAEEWQRRQRQREANDRLAGRVKRVERVPGWHRWWYPPAWSDCTRCHGGGFFLPDEDAPCEAYCDCEAGRRRSDAEAAPPGTPAMVVDWPTDEAGR
jgi:hypothetical protein